jgi:predicted transposase/invertase (TIGR01784 family)
MAKYINPYTDFGFKKLFGEEGSKEQLKDFLNELLPEQHKINTLSFKQSEQLPDSKIERKAIYDIYCESENGTKFIVEMQKAKLDFFKDRTIFYTTFPIKEQAEKGDWNFELTPVYCIAILDFKFTKDPNASKEAKKDYLNDVQLKDQYCNVFFDKLRYIFVEMPRFTKTEKEVKTHFDKWLYFLKNLEDFDDIPSILNEPVFVRCFEKARISNFDEKERNQYEESLKVYRDMKGVIETAYNDGEKKGMEKGIDIGMEKEKQKVKEKEDKLILNALNKDKYTPEEISEMLDVPLERVNLISQKMKA